MNNQQTTTEIFKLDDEVLHRFVQIFQEALLLGIDCSDIMRQVRLVNIDGVMFLDPEYKAFVKKYHENLLDEAERLQKEQENLEIEAEHEKKSDGLVFS